ncbi:MAG: DUF72 domain-containing protein [Candidatus Baltobacteraceae bacterium]
MIRIGTSGWAYADWRGRFYPKGLGPRGWLAYYCEQFDTVELNATTYRLPKESQIQTWCETVAPGFLYTVKLSRLITHRRTLPARVDEFIANYMQRARCFSAGKVAQILVQFPPYLQRDDEFLRAFLAKLPPEFRYVVEFRHQSWFSPEIETLLRERNIGFCIHDYPGLDMADAVTSPEFAYVRLHGYTALYAGSYPKRALRRWANRIRTLSEQANDVFVYFNNDVQAAAPRDAIQLRKILT